MLVVRLTTDKGKLLTDAYWDITAPLFVFLTQQRLFRLTITAFHFVSWVAGVVDDVLVSSAVVEYAAGVASSVRHAAVNA